MKRKFRKNLYSILRNEKKVEKVKKERVPGELTRAGEIFLVTWFLSPFVLVAIIGFTTINNNRLDDKVKDYEYNLINAECNDGEEKNTTEEGN